MRRKLLVGFVLALSAVGCLALWRPGLQAADKSVESTPRSGETKQKARRVKLDVNRVAASELSSLPGVSAELAERIVRNRPYRKLDDLITRKVLGKKQFARIRDFIVIRRSR